MTFKSFAAGTACTFMLAAMPIAAIGQEAVEGPDSLKIYFDTGSSRLDNTDNEALDGAARLYRDGNPIVMVVAGVADTVGSPAKNLQLSIARATTVAEALTSRGIPIERLQVLGRGNSELEVTTSDGVSEAENRIVEITWR